MARRVPNYIKQNIYQTEKYMEKIVELNKQLERWIETSGIDEYGFEYINDHNWIEYSGYSFWGIEDILNTLEEDLTYR